MTPFRAIPILTALTLVLASPPIGSAELHRYVTAADPVYRWEHVAQTSPQEGLVVHALRLISQCGRITGITAPRIILPQGPPDLPPGPVVTGTAAAEQNAEVCYARTLPAPLAPSKTSQSTDLRGLVEDARSPYLRQFLTPRTHLAPYCDVKGVSGDDGSGLPQGQHHLDRGFVVSGASNGWTLAAPVLDSRVKRSPVVMQFKSGARCATSGRLGTVQLSDRRVYGAWAAAAPPGRRARCGHPRRPC